MKTFKIDNDVKPPTRAPRGRGGHPGYPFDELNVGESFHIPSTPERPDPCRACAAAVSSATSRYKVPHPGGLTTTDGKGKEVPVMVKTRIFVIRRVDETDPRGKGARVFRLKDNEVQK
jgi:hypothetical protein